MTAPYTVSGMIETSEESKVTPIKDYDSTWHLDGFEEYRFTTQADALAAADLCVVFAAEQQVMELRYRRAEKQAVAT